MGLYDKDCKDCKEAAKEWLSDILEIVTTEDVDDPEEIYNDLIDREKEIKYLLKLIENDKLS